MHEINNTLNYCFSKQYYEYADELIRDSEIKENSINVESDNINPTIFVKYFKFIDINTLPKGILSDQAVFDIVSNNISKFKNHSLKLLQYIVENVASLKYREKLVLIILENNIDNEDKYSNTDNINMLIEYKRKFTKEFIHALTVVFASSIIYNEVNFEQLDNV